MDKETFEALQEIITFVQRTHCDVHPDAHYKAFQKVFYLDARSPEGYR